MQLEAQIAAKATSSSAAQIALNKGFNWCTEAAVPVDGMELPQDGICLHVRGAENVRLSRWTNPITHKRFTINYLDR